MRSYKIVMVGQPNVGKSMLVNALSNSRFKIGNFSGVTVDKAQSSTIHNATNLCFMDLPGTYALTNYSQEERITNEFINEYEYDLILNVVDSTNLERNLLLTAQLLEKNRNMILVLNMDDEAEKEGINIDANLLSRTLGVPCVKVSSTTKEGVTQLLDTIIHICESPKPTYKLVYSNTVEQEISKIIAVLKNKGFKDNLDHRTLAIALLKENPDVFKRLHSHPIWLELSQVVQKSLEHLYIHYNTKIVRDIFAEEVGAFAKGTATGVTKTVHGKHATASPQSITSRIDALLIQKIVGLPIFLFLMWGLFQLTFRLGQIPMDGIEYVFATLANYTKDTLGDNQFSSLLADGIITGVGAVIMFLPNILILFLGIALLETTGYMARVAFLLDGFFNRFGLHGKSFIPLVTGFGCSVPAYMSARTLKNDRDRLLTMFIIGFMSCGAKLPIYVLFAGALFGVEHAGNALFGIYILGVVFGLVSAKILKIFVFKGKDEPFVMEMPKYRLPSLKLVWHMVTLKGIMYIKKAGTFILLASILVWFASNYPNQPKLEASYNTQIEAAQTVEEQDRLSQEYEEARLSNSYLGTLGKVTTPLFAPLGFDWKLTVSIFTGLAAKEVVVATMGVLYTLGSDVDESNDKLLSAVSENVPPAVMVSFILFVMIYLPCMSAIAVFTKEAGGYKYVFYLFVFTSVAAWLVSFVGYNLARLLI